MAKFVPKVYPDILQRMINRVVARTDLSDLTDTSIFKHILAACAREVDDAYFQMNNKLDVFSIDRATGDDLDRRAEDYNPAAISRIASVRATGNLVFTRATVNPGPDITIPIGTRVEVPGEDPPIIAVTTAVGTISTGNTSSGNVSSTISTAGTDGNVAAGQLTKFSSAQPNGVENVTNPSPFTGGLDKETDDAFRERIRLYVSSLSRCTPAALESAALTATFGLASVVFARTVEDIVNLGNVIVYVDDGTGSIETTASVTGENLTSGVDFPGDVAQGGEEYLYTDNYPIKDVVTPSLVKNPGAVALIRDDAGANGYTLNPANGQIKLNTALTAGDDVAMTYTYFTGLLQETQKVIDGDPNDRTNYPGYRAAGVLVRVLPPTAANQLVTCDITVLDGYSQTDIAAQVRDEIATYINNLGIGNDVIVSEMIERAMSIEGMYDITVSTPAANVSILDDQLPRVNNAATDITIT
jgi:uncharacterized phage protein gp47/JayE